jgi:zinc protease
LKDIEAATLDDVASFFKTYYAPNNAALAIVGDFDPAEAKKSVEKYFGGIAAAKQPAKADLTEPRQEKEKRASKPDALAQKPALAFAYHAPERNTPEYYAMGLIDQILLQGDDSLLKEELVKKRGYTDATEGGTNLLGNMFNYNGPMLWTVYLFHDNDVSADKILSASDEVIERLRTKPVDKATLDRAVVKLRSDLYDQMDQLNGLGKVDLLASFALFDDDPSRINKIEQEFRKVTPELLQKTAQEYLRPTNRTVLVIEPKAAAAAEPRAGN